MANAGRQENASRKSVFMMMYLSKKVKKEKREEQVNNDLKNGHTC